VIIGLAAREERRGGRRVAWWVGPVNRLMTPEARRGRRRPGSSFGALQARAAARTGLPGRADPQFLADLQVLHASFLAVPELSFMGLAGIRAELVRHLSNRLRVREYLRANPQITAAPVPQPVFVVGLPRTGTTLLHCLLASAPGHRAPLLWELPRCLAWRLLAGPQVAGLPGPGGAGVPGRGASARLDWLRSSPAWAGWPFGRVLGWAHDS